MAASELVERALGAQARGGVLSHGLEHREADVAVRDVTAHEAPRHQRLEIAEEAGPCPRDGADIVERASAGEDTERVMELLLAVAQEAVAPGDGRAQRSLPLGKVDRPFHLESEPFVERLEDAVRREDDEARRDELDRER